MRVHADRTRGAKGRPHSLLGVAVLALAAMLCATTGAPAIETAGETAGSTEPQAVLAPDNASGSSVRPAVSIAQAMRRGAAESRRPEPVGDGERERVLRLIILYGSSGRPFGFFK